MHITLIAVGKKQPAWINQGIAEYNKRLTGAVTIRLVEVAAVKRRKSDNTDTVLQKEARNIMAAIPPGARVIVLDERGIQLSTTDLAQRLDKWNGTGVSPCLVIGGADGLHTSVMAVAGETWSLSMLTLPHGLARLLLVEQIYRAWSILKNHPYHRK